MTIRGVFFDLYGTLLSYGDVDAAWADWLTVFETFLTAQGVPLKRDDLAARMSGFLDRPEPVPAADGLTVYERRIHVFLKDLGLAVDASQIHQISDASADAWQVYISLAPDAHQVLGDLKQTHVLALVSNYDHPPYVRRLLAAFDLLDYFEAIAISGDVGFKKPDPRIFAGVLGETGLQPQEVIYVGDTLDDVRGAWAAGIQPVLIRRDGLASQQGADFVDQAVDVSAGQDELDDTLDGVPVVMSLAEVLALV